MAHITIERTVESPGEMTPTSDHPSVFGGEPAPKLKGRHRILQGLQRISSSPALAKLGKYSSSSYRSGGGASMSCGSLSSATFPYRHASGGSYHSRSSGGASTAPTSVASTSGVDIQFPKSGPRIRIVGNQVGKSRTAPPVILPLPAELRFASMDAALASPAQVHQLLEDYFPNPIIQKKLYLKRENFDFWGEMPNELKLQILRYLSPKEMVRCSIVSKGWHKTCFDGQLWMNVDASGFYSDISSESLVKIMKAAGPFVKNLNLRGCIQMKERWEKESREITDVCRNIEKFSIEECGIDEISVHHFLLRNPHLRHISVPKVAKVNNTSMKYIGQVCLQLEELNVSWCKHVDTKGLIKVVRGCPNLKILRAGEIKGFNDAELLLELFNRNTLERLEIPRCSDFDDDALTLLIHGKDPQIDPITDCVVVPPRAFRHLNFSHCSQLRDGGVKTLAHNVPGLIGLELDNCYWLTDDALAEALGSFPLLTHLSLEEIPELTNMTLQNLARAPCAMHLQHLSISSCENLGDAGMLLVVRSCQGIKSLIMDNTRVSDLVLTGIAAQVRQRNHAAMEGNASGKPEIGLRVVVYDCQHVSWTGIREVLSRNAEFYRQPHDSAAPNYPKEIVQLKSFYGYQDTVDEHTKRVLRGDLARASMLERRWAEYMMAAEEAGAPGAGHRRRRRRAREAAAVHADEEEGGARAGRRRARSGGCVVM